MLNYGRPEDVELFFNLTHKVDGIISVCKHGFNNLKQESGIPKEKLHLIPNGIDLQKFKDRAFNIKELREIFDIAKDRFVFLTPARMSPHKGIDFLLDSIHQLKNKENFHFIITTPPSRHRDEEIAYTEKLHRRLYKEKLKDSVSVCFIDYCAMPVIYNIVDGFILPSKTEQLPISILEAQASQLPVIATSVGGIPEIVINNKTGLLVEYGNKTALANSIEEVYSNSTLRELVSNTARNHVLRHHSKSQMVNKYLELYKKHDS